MFRIISNLKSQISNLKSQISNPGFPRRRGFTLVEVLVVVAIIGVLVGFLLPAIQSASKNAKRARIKIEMAQLVASIERVRTEIGGSTYPPDGTNQGDMISFFKRAFPRYTGNAPQNITPDTALAFWCGGAQDPTGTFVGFSANAANPFDASANRIGPYYEFDKTRCMSPNNQTDPVKGPGSISTSGNVVWNLYQYFPQNGIALNNNPAPAPYLYFKAVGGVYTTTAVTPSGTSNGTLPYCNSNSASTYVNSTSYQLLCPGMDGQYGKYSSAPQYPGGSNYDTTNGLDDMTNFTTGSTVGDDMQ